MQTVTIVVNKRFLKVLRTRILFNLIGLQLKADSFSKLSISLLDRKSHRYSKKGVPQNALRNHKDLSHTWKMIIG